MIVCRWKIIKEKEIEEKIIEIIDEDWWKIIVKGDVYNEMNKRGSWCGWLKNVVEKIIRVNEE